MLYQSTNLPDFTVLNIGLSPGIWHQDSMYSESKIKISAGPPSLIDPGNLPFTDLVRVDAGFRVTDARASIGERPNLCVARLPTNGMDRVLQLGLKSVARENAQSFSTHFFKGDSSSCPRIYGVPGRNVCITPASDASCLAKSEE